MINLLTAQPQTKRQLAEKANTSAREVELEINELRLAGYPICSNSDGYYIGTAAEVRACADALRSRAVHQMETAQALTKTAEAMEASPLAMPWA